MLIQIFEYIYNEDVAMIEKEELIANFIKDELTMFPIS